MAATAAGCFPSVAAAGAAMSRLLEPPAFTPTQCARTQAVLTGKRAVFTAMQTHQKQYREVMVAHGAPRV